MLFDRALGKDIFEPFYINKLQMTQMFVFLPPKNVFFHLGTLICLY